MSDSPVTNRNIAASADDATIEALSQRIGVPPEWTERLQHLRDEVHLTLTVEFQCVADDLEQLRGLLTDAAGKLSGAFRVMTGSSAQLQSTLAGLGDSREDAALRRLGELAAEITSTTGMTVQSLQFEDMATQLLQHVNRRLAILHAFSAEMAVLNPTPTGVPPTIDVREIDRLFEALERHRASLSAATRKVVQQQSLESGDIELF